jgi:acyl-CoA synthetase (AMP-forming)/AMP-acid ligase II
MNPAEWLIRAGRRAPTAPAILIGAHVQADYATFAHEAAAIGAALVARGIRPGDRVALFMKNRAEYLPALYGAWMAGAVATPINAKLHPREAAWIIGDAGAALSFACAALAADLPGPVIVAGGDDWRALTAHAPMVPVAMDSGAPVWLFYTSGTTGRPKGVTITAGNIMAMTLSYFVDVDEVTPDDAILYAAPMSHGAGLYNFMHVLRCARHVIAPSGGFDAAEVLDLARDIGNVSMFAAPTMVRRLVDAARARGDTGAGIKTIIYGGGPMYVADIEDAVAVMGPRFAQIYGQGECPMAITAMTKSEVADRAHPRWRARLASVGRAQSCVEVRVIDAQGRDLPVDEVGEIAVAGAPVMAGYWNNPTATADAIRDGWLRTGDMGALDADGYLTLHDRSKDVIISGGTNIYPREVEEALLTHPLVHEVAVVGRKHPEWGEEVIAFIVPTPGADVDGAMLDAHCLTQIARFKRPKAYVFLDGLPKNNYGKVLKTDLRAML